jgi:hypothetical protein
MDPDLDPTLDPTQAFFSDFKDAKNILIRRHVIFNLKIKNLI